MFDLTDRGAPTPAAKHHLGFYLAGQWYGLVFRPEFTTAGSAIELLDVSLLQTEVLAPLFDIDDPRTSKRIAFVGGIRGTAELEKLVDSGEFACAFSHVPDGHRGSDGHRRRRRHHAAQEHLVRAETARRDVLPPALTLEFSLVSGVLKWFEERAGDPFRNDE